MIIIEQSSSRKLVTDLEKVKNFTHLNSLDSYLGSY